MADVFISYTRADQPQAALIAAAFEAEGYSVFYDVDLVPGDSWDQRIEKELAAAKAVVVLWSQASRDRQWVRNEARDGMQRGILCPALLEPTKIPVEFSHVQAADLGGFTGSPKHKGWAVLSAAVRAKTATEVLPSQMQLSVEPPPPQRNPASTRLTQVGKLSAALGGAMALIALLVAVFIGIGPKPDAAQTVEAAVTAEERVLGRWRWEGVACGQGPTVTREGELLLFTMAGVPTFKHVIERVEWDRVHTLVVEPEDHRGEKYEFAPQQGGLEVRKEATAQIPETVDRWEACP